MPEPGDIDVTPGIAVRRDDVSLFVDVGDPEYLRVEAGSVFSCRVDFEIAELSGEGDLLGVSDALIGEHQQHVSQPGLMDGKQRAAIKRRGEIDAANFGTDERVQRCHRQAGGDLIWLHVFPRRVVIVFHSNKSGCSACALGNCRTTAAMWSLIAVTAACGSRRSIASTMLVCCWTRNVIQGVPRRIRRVTRSMWALRSRIPTQASGQPMPLARVR